MSSPYKASASSLASHRKDMLLLAEIIFILYGNDSFDTIGRKAKLHPSTVRRLWGGVTQYPQFLTLQKLASGVGLKVSADSSLSLQEVK